MNQRNKPFKMDFHVHSHFSPDSNVTMEEMIKKAIELNITDLAITDHVDFDADLASYQSDWDFDRDESERMIQQLKFKYQDKINLYQGLEVGIQPHLGEKNTNTVMKNQYDFVIASLHSVEGKDLYNRKYFDLHSPKESVCIYYEELYQSISRFDAYSVLGHLDLYLRYQPSLSKVTIGQYYDELTCVLRKVIEDGKGIEINAGGFRYGLGHTNPHKELLKIYKELHGEIITFGSDAHSLNYLGANYDETVYMLREIGFKYLCTFHQMKPEFHKIEL